MPNIVSAFRNVAVANLIVASMSVVGGCSDNQSATPKTTTAYNIQQVHSIILLLQDEGVTIKDLSRQSRQYNITLSSAIISLWQLHDPGFLDRAIDARIVVKKNDNYEFVDGYGDSLTITINDDTVLIQSLHGESASVDFPPHTRGSNTIPYDNDEPDSSLKTK